MVKLTRPSKASMFSTQPNQEVPEVAVADLFSSSFKAVADVVAVLCGSSKRAESLVAIALGEIASGKISDNSSDNVAALVLKSMARLQAEWVPTPTPEGQRDSPLALLRSLPFSEAGVFVLANFDDLDEEIIAKAMSCPLPMVRAQLDRATTTLKQRFNRSAGNLQDVFEDECQELTVGVLADPQHLVGILLTMSTSKAPEIPCSCQALRIPPSHRKKSPAGSN